MVFDIFIIVIALIVLLIGSITDMKVREVPDWVSYSFIVLAFFSRIIYSFITGDYHYVLEGALGFAAMLVLALAMFYLGQWGGGDAKLLMGLGALMGLRFSSETFLIGFLINSLLSGAAIGFVWAIILAIMKRRLFLKSFYELRRKTLKIKLIILVTLMIAFASSFFIKVVMIKVMIFVFFTIGVVTFYLWMFTKAVELSCMHKRVDPSKLTEGDWIVGTIKSGKKVIASEKDLGVSLAQIKRLTELYNKKKIGKVLMKEGMPFVPSFLVSFIVTLIFGNWFLAII